MFSRLALLSAALFSAGAARAYDIAPALPDRNIQPAQIYNSPPADIDDGGLPGGGIGQGAGELLTRIDRLERDLRRVTGQNEELQHKVQVLEEQLRAARQESPKVAASSDPSRAATGVATPAVATSPAPTTAKRGDAFDPAASPGAPGAPKPLGTTQPSAPLANPPKATTLRDAGQPMDISHGRLVGEEPAAPAEITATTAPAAPSGPKEEYEAAVASLKAGKYEMAEKSLTAFLLKNGKTKFAPAATFNLGESFFLRGRHREAAEKYLEVSQKYASSSLAPESLLRLGQSLGAMGAKEQACASFAEIDVKYPAAANRVKEAAQRESKKIACQ
ncbi:MAG: tetratricopeptide repeat protein [Methylocystis sp.]|nr:tetratricopeptide repeat protein [Methylocystis sp.]